MKEQNGIPVRDIARVVQGPKVRLGKTGNAVHYEDGREVDDGDVVQRIVFIQKGTAAEATLKASTKKRNN